MNLTTHILKIINPTSITNRIMLEDFFNTLDTHTQKYYLDILTYNKDFNIFEDQYFIEFVNNMEYQFDM